MTKKTPIFEPMEYTLKNSKGTFKVIKYEDGAEHIIPISTTWDKDSVWADDIKAYVHKSKCITVRGGKHFVLHSGKGRLFFFIEEKNLFFYAHVYNSKTRDIVQSYCFEKRPAPEEVRAVVFENTFHIARARSVIGDKPFVVAFKHRITLEKNWKTTYISNIGSSGALDSQLNSYHELLRGIEPDFVRGATMAEAIDAARKQIQVAREMVLESPDMQPDFPLYDVYGIWTNYTEGMGIVSTTNDFVRRSPNFFSMTKFNSAADVKGALF